VGLNFVSFESNYTLLATMLTMCGIITSQGVQWQ